MTDQPAKPFESVLDAELAGLRLPTAPAPLHARPAADVHTRGGTTPPRANPGAEELNLELPNLPGLRTEGIIGNLDIDDLFKDVDRQRPEKAETAPPPAAHPPDTIEVTGLPRRIGLALSGGGIRSATFSLGVLQALAFRGKLTGLDYLSTVSGGGYIGSWLTAWILRTKSKGGLDHVQQQLRACVVHDRATVRAGLPTAAVAATVATPAPELVEPPEVTWLRRYSNYLAPRVGALSTDSLTLLTTWFRNTLLNLVIVVTLLASAFTFIHLLAFVPAVAGQSAGRMLGGIAFVAAVALFVYMAFNLVKLDDPGGDYGGAWATPRRVKPVVWTLALAAALCGSLWFFDGPPDWQRGLGALTILLVAVAIVWLILVARQASARSAPMPHGDTVPSPPGDAGAPAPPARTQATPSAWARLAGTLRRSAAAVPWANLAEFAAGAIAAGGATVLLLWGFTVIADGPSFAGVLTWGPAMVLFAFGVAGSVFVGISGRAYFERSREWWSRMNALIIAAGAAWLVIFWTALYLRPWVDWVVLQFPVWTKVLSAGWLAGLVALVKARAPAGASSRTRLNVDRVMTLLALFGLLGFVVVVALLTDFFVLLSAQRWFANPLDQAATLGEHLRHRSDLLATLPADLSRLPLVLGLFVGLLVTFVVFIGRVDVNKFSLHNMYKNRLVRCYLGASRPVERRAQPFTGFDEADDLDLASIPPEQRPFHLLNAALNLSQGSNLAWQERKSASFTFSPRFCGFELAQTQGDTTQHFLDDGTPLPPGYCPTTEYANKPNDSVRVEERALTLGSVLATSGAAVSPNMGTNTNTLRAFMLTLLNARLGRWCPNPAGTAYSELSPHFGFAWFMQELFGATNEKSRYVYLSDGGHFENLGLYELVRRKCSHIVVVDAAADPERSFGDLGRAIRQCRVDFGVEIDIDLRKLRSARTGWLPRSSHAWGTIRYDEKTFPPKVGALLYIKPTLTRDAGEPVDVLAYAQRNPTFPQQTTADQFFDESQFESYRRLGVHIGLAAIATPNGQLLPDAPPALATQTGTAGSSNRTAL